MSDKQIKFNEQATTTRELELKETFNYLKEMKVVKVNDKLMLGNEEEIPFNISYVMEESEFVAVWLKQFALGNAIGINYFNIINWNKISGNGQLSVLIVDNEHKPVLIVPPLVSTNLTAKEYDMLRQANVMMYNTGNIPGNQSGNLNANLPLANALNKELEKIPPLTFTTMIPEEYYAKHNVIPLVEQQVHYIKDHINAGQDIRDKLNKVKDCLTDIYNKKEISKEDQEFLLEVSKGEITLEGYEPETTTNAKTIAKEEENDPLSC